MFRRLLLALFLATLPVLPVGAETVVVQPNRPVEVPSDSTPPAAGTNGPIQSAATSKAVTDDGRLEKLARELSSKPAPSAMESTVAQPKTAPAEAAIPANEKKALGAARDDATSGTVTRDDGGSSWVMTTLTALGVVVGLILVLRGIVAKVTGRAPASAHSPVIEVLSRTSVAPKNHVLLLRLGQRILVVGDSAAGLATLADISDPEEVASLLQTISASKSGSASQGFADTLDDFDGRYDEQDQPIREGRDSGEHRMDRARDGLSSLTARIRAMASGREGT
ncbi:MAG: FliO/MopB family protein [Phycisphaeraceae bacterium]|nr:FliO/MopB family protein [Phycisphaeraceae bacterium]